MSLIGLHEQAEDYSDEAEEGQFLPKYIDPFSKYLKSPRVIREFNLFEFR